MTIGALPESNKRLSPEPKDQDQEDKRSPYERDRARIVHSAAFRRLQGKTQVYGFGASDFYRSRLSHSLEVAQLGKGLAINLNADPNLVEAICLAHDIGHPPFGHAGEQALQEALNEDEGFNGNAQNLRIVTFFERKNTAYQGLNLTVGALDGLLKYPEVLNEPFGSPALPRDKGYYKSDADLVSSFHVQSSTPIRTFECQLMNWSDDVAYAIHDLEDAIIIGTVRLEDLRNEDVRERIVLRALEAYGKEYPDTADSEPLRPQEVESYIECIIRNCFDPVNKKGTDRLALLKMFTASQINELIISVSATPTSIASPSRYARELTIPTELKKRVESFKAIVMICVIRTPAVVTLQHAGKQIVRQLFEIFSGVEKHKDAYRLQEFYPADWQVEVRKAVTVYKESESRVPILRFARDFVASMTDAHAEATWRRLYSPVGGSLFTSRL